MAKRLISARAAARYVGVRNTTFDQWVADGRVPAERDPLTKRVRFSTLALDRWLETFGNDNLGKAS